MNIYSIYNNWLYSRAMRPSAGGRGGRGANTVLEKTHRLEPICCLQTLPLCVFFVLLNFIALLQPHLLYLGAFFFFWMVYITLFY